MENAQLINLSRQVVLRRQLDVIANNVANINTTGYKAQQLAVEEFVMPVARENSFRPGDKPLSYVADYTSSYDFSPGPSVPTGNPLDAAINGKGWFAIQTADGERYTRNGSFGINANGQLVTQDGNPVLGEGGPIILGPDDSGIQIAADGTISTSQGVRGKLRIVSFANEEILKPVGDNLFSGENPGPNAGARVTQGMIERSNVRGVVEMTRMIDVTRTYQTVSNIAKQTDDLRKDAINALGRLEA
ncbi:flagellar basal-body rod protein FlgF [Rhodobium orientis]|uniref:Flagellar basal-body rod protein FlgF n=1 Tax=Rhodobium orientis TaxID=34017 RepID=A0A327JH53_9HYPH|nr:flagellar basal-body rod protein FlgF [Rhodobium orientis]MBB4301819.1 flagellar basal-body rod protein FlgF [Rhodobium orientis]MBK5948406.1 flagellar basal-body rod protein FlgF [Rhodobium orientis]RAI24653.1 flagellar basal-body rod protein FlgF [Rhodobium orientis]